MVPFIPILPSDLLQLGHALSRVETLGLRRRLAEVGIASIGPRALTRGNRGAQQALLLQAHASIGPRALTRGNVCEMGSTD